jgi:hypothetical protein
LLPNVLNICGSAYRPGQCSIPDNSSSKLQTVQSAEFPCHSQPVENRLSIHSRQFIVISQARRHGSTAPAQQSLGLSEMKTADDGVSVMVIGIQHGECVTRNLVRQVGREVIPVPISLRPKAVPRIFASHRQTRDEFSEISIVSRSVFKGFR